MAISIARILSQLRIPVPISMGGTGSTTSDAARTALGVIGRNRIINGDCRIAQRASGAFGTASGGYAGPDRFYVANSASAAGQFTQSQGTIVDGGVTKSAVVQTVNTAIVSTATTNFWSGIVQQIEGFNCYDLVGSPVAVSFIFKTNVTGTFSVAVRDTTGTVSFITSFAAVSGVPVKVAISVPAVPLTAVVPRSTASGMQVWIGALNTGTHQAPAINVWNTGSFISAPSATNWGATAGNYISLTDLQLEAGTSATEFERRPYGQELALCQRYYRTGNAVLNGYSTVGTGNDIWVPFGAVMRVSPTLAYAQNTMVNCSVYDVRLPQADGFVIHAVVVSTGGYIWQCNWTASAEL